VSVSTEFSKSPSNRDVHHRGTERQVIMPTQEIAREAWSEFFHGFSSSHRGWLASVEVFDVELGGQMTQELPFEGITAELREAENDKIWLMIGGSPDQHVTHTISKPTNVRIYQTAEGASECMQIKSGDETTLVRFQSPALADLLPDVILE
jgi:hypothetical protein